MKRLFITGASGFLGWNICHVAQESWDVFGTGFSHDVKIPNVNIAKVDLRDFKEIKRIFNDVRPHAVIHTAALSNPDFCQENQIESHKINVDAPINIAGLCSDYGIPYVFTSTDLVFDGLKPPYREIDPVCPVNVYGEQKVLAEEGVLKSYPVATICRLPLMFGLSGPVATSFIQPMIKAMEEGQELHLFVDEFRTPLSARTAISGLFISLDKVSGLIHLGGPERISRYGFGKLMVKILKIGNARLIPCKQKDMEVGAPRPQDVSLDSTKALALGFKPLPLANELQEICKAL